MSESLRDLLARTAARIADYRDATADAAVFPAFDAGDVRASLGGPLPEHATPASAVVDQLADAVAPALVTSTGPRYFGFVIGGALDAATCSDLLASGWDQNAYNALSSPAAAIVEEIAGAWLKELLGLPASASFGFATGAQAANTIGLAAARHHVLSVAGWDVEQEGLIGAPRVRVVAGEERHATIDRTLRLLGLGTAVIEAVPADGNGAVDVARLAEALASGPDAPTIVCLQAGNVNTGAVDDLAGAILFAHERGAWVHVDGAFGLWAGASDATRHLVTGVADADSWACDGHKWLNVPYDCGFVFCAHPDAHAAAMRYTAAYLVGHDAIRSGGDYVLESSRRARGFATWAALRQLGRAGIADLVERCCALARHFAVELARIEGIDVANEVVLNQVLVRFGSDDAHTDAVIDAVQRDGTCWMGATTWHGRRLMRISVSNWSTTEADVDRSVAAIAAAHERVTNVTRSAHR
jgi:glutamate/tyrosine decarboxylase-like PLP-dependent enzyme